MQHPLQRTTRRRGRAGFTLLEMVLASAIGLLIMGALYYAISIQLQFAESSRRVVDEATLARSLAARIARDVAPSVGLPDPGRFRSTQGQQSGQQGTTQPGATGTTQPTGQGSTTPSATPGATTTATTTSTTGGAAPGSSSEDPAAEMETADPVRAFYGDSTTLRLYVSRVPGVLTGAPADDQASIVSDQRVVEYWLATGDRPGLARQEIPIVTAAPEEVPWARGTGAEGDFVIAPEVTDLEFSYFDGTDWLTTWNSAEPGTDGRTPKGPPLAIAIVLEMTMPGAAGTQPRVRTYRQVVSIPTANGLPAPTATDTGMGPATDSTTPPP